jgi:hypothetical protein
VKYDIHGYYRAYAFEDIRHFEGREYESDIPGQIVTVEDGTLERVDGTFPVLRPIRYADISGGVWFIAPGKRV